MTDHDAFQAAYNPDDRRAECPDPDSTLLSRIEVEFAVPVEMTQDEQRRLVQLLDEMVNAPWNQIQEGCHWLAGMGHKPHWSQADARMLGIPIEGGAPARGEPTFDEAVFHIETCARPFVSEKERARKVRRQELVPSVERSLEERVVEALEAVAHFWGRDPKAFGDEATLGTIAVAFAPLARKCERALTEIKVVQAKRNEQGVE